MLLSRLENMLENSAEVNLLVTGILAQMASYPQPLLRCFLLNTHPVFQPRVRSLYQVPTAQRPLTDFFMSLPAGIPVTHQMWCFLYNRWQNEFDLVYNGVCHLIIGIQKSQLRTQILRWVVVLLKMALQLSSLFKSRGKEKSVFNVWFWSWSRKKAEQFCWQSHSYAVTSHLQG